jgi:hypothetical protein
MQTHATRAGYAVFNSRQKSATLNPVRTFSPTADSAQTCSCWNPHVGCLVAKQMMSLQQSHGAAQHVPTNRLPDCQQGSCSGPTLVPASGTPRSLVLGESAPESSHEATCSSSSSSIGMWWWGATQQRQRMLSAQQAGAHPATSAYVRCCGPLDQQCQSPLNLVQMS